LLFLVFPRQLPLRFAAFTLAGLALPFFLQDPDYVARQYGNWLVNLRQDDRSGIALYRAYRDLWMLIRLFDIPVSMATYRWIQLAGAAWAAMLVLWLRWRGVGVSQQAQACLGLGACWIALLGPASESATYIVLAPTMAWALADLWYAPRGWPIRVPVLLSVALFTAARLAGVVSHTAHLHALGPHPLGAAFLWLGLSATILADGGRSAQSARPAEPVAQAA
jgi:hypothetical protein